MATKKILKTEAETQSDLLEKIKNVSDEKSIPVEVLVETIEGSLVSAYKKAYGGTGAVRVMADYATGEFRVFAQKLVVQSAINTNTEIAWRDARAANPGLNLGDMVEVEVTPSGFGRIAAQTAKQVLLQKLREAERQQVVSEYADKSGEMVRGTVQRVERGNVIVQIGKAEAILPKREQVPGEHYRFGDSIFAYVVEVRSNMRGPSITISRTHFGLVRQLFLLEVPEIADGIVELKALAREAGQRTKIAVAANNPDVDPVGACVGPRGGRVGKVVNELGNEKVDIVRWNEDPIAYISNALSPAQISKVLLVEESGNNSENKGTATVLVVEDQQSLAIGKQGQNVRLAAKLTGWKIDIRTEKQYAEEQAKKMFDLNGEVALPLVTRESKDAHAEIFAVDGDATTDETATDEAATDEAATEADMSTHETPEGATSDASEIAGAATQDSVAADIASNDGELTRGLETDVGSSAPLDDVELPGTTFEIPTTSGTMDTLGRENEAASVTGGMSSVAPADSVQA